MESKKINQLATAMSPSSTDLTIIGDPITGVSKKATLQQISSLFGSAVSFYTNLAAFPATGTIDTLYCAKDTNKLYIWSGTAYVQTFPSQTLLDTYQLKSEKGASNGYASLDSSGKVPISQLPSSIMEYKGMWNAATNTPTLANGTGDTGDVYICNVAGTVNFGAGAITFAVGDYVVYSGTIWQRSSGAVGTVTSVSVTEIGDALTITGSPITTSGTINIGFAGTSAQYVAGNGSLVTFPTIITEAQNLITEVYNETGATLTKGTVVYINGGHGNLPTITKAIATSDATSAQTYGIVRTDITNNNNGYVVVVGRILDIDTQAYAAGTQLYLSSTTAGVWTSTKQYAPAHLVYVGIVTRSHPTQGVVEVKIQNGYELDELHNVSAQTPSNNQGIFYNSSNSLWENKSIATALGYTPISLTSLSASSPLSYNNTTGAFSISQATTSTNGYLSSTDWNTFNGKQAALTNPVTGTGTSGQVAYFNGTTSLTSNAAFAFTPTSQLLINNSVTAASAIARGTNLTPTLTAAANNDVLVGLDINPTFTNGAFTGVSNLGLRVGGASGLNYDIANQRLGIGTASLLYKTTILTTTANDQALRAINSAITGSNYAIVGQADGSGATTNTAGYFSASGATTNWGLYVINGQSYFANNINIGTTTQSSFGLNVNGLNGIFTGGSTGGVTFGTRNTGGNITLYNTGGDFRVYINSADQFVIKNNGNVLINTTTDAGYKLDVNGTARVQNKLSVGTPSAASAVFEVTSTTQGVLFPRMTAAQKNAISSPAAGLLIFQTDGTVGLYIYDGSTWRSLTMV